MWSGKQDFILYDFQKSTQTKLIRRFGSNGIELISNESTGASFQMDLFLAGTIQEVAIVYFVFENVFGIRNYIVPYYPTHSSGIRLGLSWELFD
jgi:hypothetical protein